jgi:hypothetical protein
MLPPIGSEHEPIQPVAHVGHEGTTHFEGDGCVEKAKYEAGYAQGRLSMQGELKSAIRGRENFKEAGRKAFADLAKANDRLKEAMELLDDADGGSQCDCDRVWNHKKNEYEYPRCKWHQRYEALKKGV